ncbi:bifunctional aminoglycoside phosphotransferase/ATP-binding protein [Bosea sp. TND4EK4]|uniref:bifunctional aminoglycoside phosphotransferase/ATP-binding protein n=1 Tax=Bosea sp. TND4EK4 TaxID=1907408 RepID=UPI000955DAA7|nr:bifunctional aminoglycoside phosphotransferase/ATP-binding protein [Bosea sp. TND4EK4]SIP88656.1 hypothetical protein SAMN05880592_10124 [Bosea sp. TND4EK4]
MQHTTEQNETICFLGSAAGIGNGGPIELINTHISVVLLTGDKAFKLKRAVRYPYVDLSTPQKRLAMCERELLLNRRAAPELYRAVHHVTREENGCLALNGKGALVDAVLEMKRFDGRTLLDRLAREDHLGDDTLEELAHVIARFHAAAPVSQDHHGAARMARVLDGNDQAFKASNILPPAETAAISGDLRSALARLAPLLDERARAGKVRHVHGDLHLRNICLLHGEPLLFDCLEFDDELATTDVLYDLAFVLMDLWRLKLRRAANLLFNRYLDICGDETGLALLPFFMAVRAVVRTHVAAADDSKAVASRLAEARGHLALCREVLRPVSPILVAIGGYSGSGKSTLAAHIAPELGRAPGARIASSDRIRKRLCGVSAQTRLPASAYTTEMSTKTYHAMLTTASGALSQGQAAIADAVFDRRSDREAAREISARLGVPFQGLWLSAPQSLLFERIATRPGGVSDATAEVLKVQLAGKGEAREWRTVAASGDREAAALAALRAIGNSGSVQAVWPSAVEAGS